MMAYRWRFTAEFKPKMILKLVNGAKRAAELCHHHHHISQIFTNEDAICFQSDGGSTDGCKKNLHIMLATNMHRYTLLV